MVEPSYNLRNRQICQVTRIRLPTLVTVSESSSVRFWSMTIPSHPRGSSKMCPRPERGEIDWISMIPRSSLVWHVLICVCVYIYIYANICIYVCSICPYFFGYKHDIDDYPPARTKVEHSFTHVHTRWSTNGPFHTGQICCRAPFLGFSAWISGAGGFPTIVVFGGGFEARVILSLPEVWDTTSVALRKQPKSRHFSEATRHSFMLMIYCFPLPKHPQIIILKIKNRKMPQKHTKTLVVVPFQPPSPSCANICQAGSPSTSLTWRPGRRPMARCKEGFTSLLRRKTLVWYAVIVENTWEHYKTKQNAELTLLGYAHVIWNPHMDDFNECWAVWTCLWPCLKHFWTTNIIGPNFPTAPPWN